MSVVVFQFERLTKSTKTKNGMLYLNRLVLIVQLLRPTETF